jgi:ATP-dependent Clp protease ATP-binding subunit ClpA
MLSLKGFTQRLPKVIARAAQEAYLAGRSFITVQDVEFALVWDPRSSASRSLVSVKADLDAIRTALKVDPDPSGPPKSHKPSIPPNEDTRLLLARAAEIAHQCGEKDAGTNHLLVATIEDPKSRMSRVLETQGISLAQIRELALKLRDSELTQADFTLPQSPEARRRLIHSFFRCDSIYEGCHSVLAEVLDGKVEDVPVHVFRLIECRYGSRCYVFYLPETVNGKTTWCMHLIPESGPDDSPAKVVSRTVKEMNESADSTGPV